MEEYLRRYVHDGPALTLSVSLDHRAPYIWGRDAASSGGYWAIETSYGSQEGHAVPLVGGSSVAEVGFLPVVGQGGSGGHGSSLTYFGGLVTATYSIADASGKVLERRQFPLFPVGYLTTISLYPDARLEVLHDTASYIAQRAAKVR
jgi:hypothetical protein